MSSLGKKKFSLPLYTRMYSLMNVDLQYYVSTVNSVHQKVPQIANAVCIKNFVVTNVHGEFRVYVVRIYCILDFVMVFPCYYCILLYCELNSYIIDMEGLSCVEIVSHGVRESLLENSI